jgi:uncharacterized phage protein gp47/JayE
MSSLSSTGFVLQTLADRLTALNTALQGIFGSNINLDPNSIDGETIGIFAEAVANEDLLAQAVYQSFDPAQATGAALSRLVTLNGITRNLGSYSLAEVTIGGTSGRVIPEGSLVGPSDSSSTWATLDEVTIGTGGTVDVEVQCTTDGAVAAAAGTLTTILTPVYGWLTVTNASAATEGSATESDEELRARRSQSTATPSQSVIDGIYGAILEVSGVTNAVLYENDSEAVDANGLPAHSMNLVVSGGTAAAIGKVLWLKRSAGSTQVGAQSVVIDDSQGNPHTMKFDRPAAVEIYVVINGTALSGYPSDGAAQIQAAIVAWAADNLSIGDDVIQSELYTPVNSVTGSSITSIFIGIAAAPNSTANVAIAFNAIAEFDASRITVNIN